LEEGSQTYVRDLRHYKKFSNGREVWIGFPNAEGFNKRTLRDKSHFYNIAQSSLEELRYYFILTKDLGFMKENKEYLDSTEEIGRMLNGLIRSLR
jgi:four helix bundle protein